MTTTLIAPAPVAPGWAADVELFGEFGTFKDRIKNVKEHGGYFTALCPAHDDTESSLSFTTGRTQAVVATCHAGCSYSDIRETVFPGWKRRHPGDAGRTSETVYTYRDENGGALFDVVRGPGKNFWQRHWDPDTEEWVWNVKDVRRVPYRLPELAKAVADSKLVFIVEGEKDADRLTQQGLVATTNPSGAG
jgi:hypothetical protein